MAAEEEGAPHRAADNYGQRHPARTVRCTNGAVQLVMDCHPAFDYGRHREDWTHTDHGFNQVSVQPPGANLTLTLTSDIRIGIEGPSAQARTLVKEGETRYCALSWGSCAPPRTYADANARLLWTAHHWRHWLARGRRPDHRWRSHLTRSARTLKGLAHDPTGAIAAAATTSLPGNAVRRAELGLPVQPDPRLDLRALGGLRWALSGGERLLRVHRGHH